MQICLTPEGKVARTLVVRLTIKVVCVVIMTAILAVITYKASQWNENRSLSSLPDPYRRPPPDSPPVVATPTPPPPATVTTQPATEVTPVAQLTANIIQVTPATVPPPLPAPKLDPPQPKVDPSKPALSAMNDTKRKYSVDIPAYGVAERIIVPKGYEFQTRPSVALSARTPDVTTKSAANAVLGFNDPGWIELQNSTGQAFTLEYWIWSIKGRAQR